MTDFIIALPVFVMRLAGALFLLSATILPLLTFSILPVLSTLFGVYDGICGVADESDSWKCTLDRAIRRSPIVNDWFTILLTSFISFVLGFGAQVVAMFLVQSGATLFGNT